ncbi:twin-argninine leader-binding protein DmsD, partial [Klebsiella pneumoniae]
MVAASQSRDAVALSARTLGPRCSSYAPNSAEIAPLVA